MAKETNDSPGDDKLRAIHHYVPQSYLRRFAIDGKPNQVYAYEIDKQPYPTNIKNVAGQRDLYTFKDSVDKTESAELESLFAGIDGKGHELLQALDELPDGLVELPESDKGELYSYIALLHTRNVQERKHWAEMYGQMALVHMKTIAANEKIYHRNAQEALGEKYEFDTAESARHEILNGDTKIEFDPMDQYFLATTLSMSKELYYILMKMKRAFLVSTNSETKTFVTSDNPVTHYAAEKPKHFMQGLG